MKIFYFNLRMTSQEKSVHGHTKSYFGILGTPVYMTLVTDFFYRNTLTVISRGVCVKLGASKALNLVYLIKCSEITVSTCKLEHKNVLNCSDELQQIRSFIITGIGRGLQICHFFPLFSPLFK